MTEPKLTLRFSWGEVDVRLARRLVIALYERSDRWDDAERARALEDEQVPKVAQTSFGRPPASQRFDKVADVVRDYWLPAAPAGVVIALARLVQLGLTGPERTAKVHTKKLALTFLDRRNLTETFKHNLREAFVNAHKVRGPVASSGGGHAGPWATYVDITGEGLPARNPFDHQRRAWTGLDALARARTVGGRSGLVVLPTGAGKTFTLVHWLLRQLGNDPRLRVLWVADQQELVDQAAREFTRQARTMPDGFRRRLRAVHGAANPATTIADPTVDIVCATRQSVLGQNFSSGAQKRLAALIERPCVVVVDEAHHAVSPTYEKMLDFITRRCPSVVLVGLTATPWPSGQGMTRRLMERFPQKVIEVQVRDMVRSGVLARPMTHTIDTHQLVTLSPTEIAQLGGGDLPPSVLRRLDDEVRNRIIVNTWVARHEQWGKTLVFACDIEHADRLHAMFLDNSVRSQVVHSRSDEEQREVLKEFREGAEPRVLVSVGMLLEGVDVPDARTAFLTRPTRSRILMRQMIGRVLRGPDAGGEEIAHIVDLRDRWSDDVDVLAPVDIPGVDHIPTRTEDTEERQLPRIPDEDSDTPIPEDVVRRIEREYAVLIKAVPYAPALTSTELVGFYELGHLNVPVFDHVRERWDELIKSAITERWSVHSAMELFNDLPAPRPSRQDIDEIVAHCRSTQVAPALVPIRTGLSTRQLAEELVSGGAMTEREKVTWLRERYEASLARAAYDSFQGFFEAVQAEILALTLDARASDPESPHAHKPRVRLPKLTRSTDPLA